MELKVEWRKVNPADLSVTCCADYFAFSKDGRVLLVDELMQKCTFTKVIQASTTISYSLYELDIWVGYQISNLKEIDRVNLEEVLTLNLTREMKGIYTPVRLKNRRWSIESCA